MQGHPDSDSLSVCSNNLAFTWSGINVTHTCTSEQKSMSYLRSKMFGLHSLPKSKFYPIVLQCRGVAYMHGYHNHVWVPKSVNVRLANFSYSRLADHVREKPSDTYTAKTVNYWGAGENLEFGLDYWTGLPIVDRPSWKLPETKTKTLWTLPTRQRRGEATWSSNLSEGSYK